MGMDTLQLRESEIFRILKKIKGVDFVLIGGYAANSYALPRFSVDCDIVLRKKDVQNAKHILESEGYSIVAGGDDAPYYGEFLRSEITIAETMRASVDMLIDKVSDRQSGVSFDADWIFENSERRTIIGKTITERINIRVINADALFVMKFISARTTDIRDIFMMVTSIKDFEWVRNEIGLRLNFEEQYGKIFEKISNKHFKDNLQGVYGYIDEKIFQKHLDMIRKLPEANS